MTHLDLFSGIGGFALAARWAGFETVQFVENEPYAQKVLAKNFPGVPIAGDIYEFDATEYLGVGLLTGGFPCQPFSQAGKRLGKEDDRAIWPQMLRVIREARPTWIIGENVSGIISMELDSVLSDLEGEGYTTQAVVIPAVAKDARHRRDRVWIVAYANGNSKSNGSINEGKRCRKLGKDVADSSFYGSSEPKQDGNDRIKSKRGDRLWSGIEGCSEDVADSNPGLSKRENKGIFTGGNSTDNGSKDVAYSQSKRVEGCGAGGEQESHTYGQEGLPLCEGERSRAANWLTEPPVGRVVNGLPNRVDRLKGLGNAIVPQVAYEIMRLMK